MLFISLVTLPCFFMVGYGGWAAYGLISYDVPSPTPLGRPLPVQILLPPWPAQEITLSRTYFPLRLVYFVFFLWIEIILYFNFTYQHIRINGFFRLVFSVLGNYIKTIMLVILSNWKKTHHYYVHSSAYIKTFLSGNIKFDIKYRDVSKLWTFLFFNALLFARPFDYVFFLVYEIGIIIDKI